VRHVPEVITGLIGAGFIVTAFIASIRYNRRASVAHPALNQVGTLSSQRKAGASHTRFPPEPGEPE
jgi:hypothetical protein